MRKYSFCLFFSSISEMRERISSPNSSVISFWPLLLLVGFGSAIFLPAVVVGYRWTVEFSLAGFLILTILWELFCGSTDGTYRSSHKENLLTVYPLGVFTIWSFISIVWAHSS